jgi:hypothetical protein
LTPLEIAQELGHIDLFEILSPIIRHPLPRAVLEALERNFHVLIKSDLEKCDFAKYLNLPSMDVLTELETPEMWFPIPYLPGNKWKEMVT